MARRRGITFQYDGFNSFIERCERLGRNVDDVAEEELKGIAIKMTNDFSLGISKHTKTGRTKESLIKEPEFKNLGTKIETKVGFRKPDGLPAAFINYGTPTNNPDPFITKAINRYKRDKVFKRIFKAVIER